MKDKHKCIDCEVEFKIETENDLEPIYCPFCGTELINLDLDEELDKELEDILFEELEL